MAIVILVGSQFLEIGLELDFAFHDQLSAHLVMPPARMLMIVVK